MSLKFRKSLLITITFIFLAPFPGAGETFKWVDENGTMHFTDSLHNIPMKYRKDVEEKKLGDVQRYRGSGDVSDIVTPSPVKKKGSSEGLREIKVPYGAYEGYASRIIISVTFNGSVTAPMLLDTGAPGMVISPELADRIGLFDKDDGNLIYQAGGIGGRVPAILTIVDKVSVGAAETKFLPTTVTRISSRHYQGLVGMDFMANYDLQIDNQKRQLIFKELPPNSNRPAGRNEHWWRSKYSIFADLKNSWGVYLKRLENISPKTTMLERLKEVAEYQVRESDKLYKRLERYASQNSVPRRWRK